MIDSHNSVTTAVKAALEDIGIRVVVSDSDGMRNTSESDINDFLFVAERHYFARYDDPHEKWILQIGEVKTVYDGGGIVHLLSYKWVQE